jgi:hypothetical protein
MSTTVSILKSGTKQNAFFLFGYQDRGNFLYAGIDAKTGTLRIGQRSAAGWVDAATLNAPIRTNTDYPLDVTLNGSAVTLTVGNKGQQSTLQYTFPSAFGVSMLGVGTDNSVSSYNNIQILKLPIAFTYTYQQDFSDGVAHNFTPQVGTWTVANSLYNGAPDSSGAAITTRPLAVAPSSYLEYSATVNTGSTAGLIFDYYNPTNFKFAAIVAGSNQVILGHRTAAGWFTDSVATTTITAGTTYALLIGMKGQTVGVGLNGSSVFNFTYNELLTDGGLGFLSRGGTSSFGSLLIQGDDPAYSSGGFNEKVPTAPSGPVAGVTPLTPDELAPIVAAAVRRWSASQAFPATAVERLADVQFQIVALPDSALGREIGGTTVEISPTAAGYGWFIDTTPLDNSEFPLRSDGGTSLSTNAGPAAGRIDLLTVVTHELGHALGLDDLDSSANPGNVMDDMLLPGIRRLPVISDALAEEVMGQHALTSGALRPLDQPRSTGTTVAPASIRMGGLSSLRSLCAPIVGTTVIGGPSLAPEQTRHLGRRRPGDLHRHGGSSRHLQPSLLLGQHRPVWPAHTLPAGPSSLRFGRSR